MTISHKQLEAMAGSRVILKGESLEPLSSQAGSVKEWLMSPYPKETLERLQSYYESQGIPLPDHLRMV